MERPFLAAASAFVVAFTVRYPDAFTDSARLRPGRYEVEWRKGGATAGGASVLAQALAQLATPALAYDSFTVQGEGNAGATKSTETSREGANARDEETGS